jgi:hypothetical protein
MSKRSLLLTLAVCGAALGTVQSARADAIPGEPAPGAASNGRVHIWENDGLSEVKNQPVANPVCDGYVTMPEPPAASSPGTSDFVVFHDANVKPSGLCNATCVTVLSDPNADPAGGEAPDASSVFPNGCLFQVTNPDGSCSATLLPGYVLCAPNTCVAGSACLPPNLLGLTAATVAAGAGTSPNANPTQTIAESRLFRTNNEGLSYDAVNPTGTLNHYTVVSDVPALPPWAFALLGCVLAGSAFVVLRRRGDAMTPSA